MICNFGSALANNIWLSSVMKQPQKTVTFKAKIQKTVTFKAKISILRNVYVYQRISRNWLTIFCHKGFILLLVKPMFTALRFNVKLSSSLGFLFVFSASFILQEAAWVMDRNPLGSFCNVLMEISGTLP